MNTSNTPMADAAIDFLLNSAPGGGMEVMELSARVPEAQKDISHHPAAVNNQVDRRVQNTDLRLLILAGDLMALKLSLFDTSADGEFGQELKTLMEAWEISKRGIRQDRAAAQAGRWTTTPGAQS